MYGRYQLFAKIGSGGMAEVFLAVARGPSGFNKLVVVKRMRSLLADQHEPLVSMFLDEARLAARLTHPNIVHTYEVGEHHGAYFIAMEYLEGQPLNRVYRAPDAATKITPAMWARIIAQALAGLHHAHELADYDGTPLDVVHRDVSPQNLFLTYSGDVKVVDFGIARSAINETETETGVLKGKVSYMAPEQLHGHVDRRSDVFAVGATLWELLAGRKLFLGDSPTVMNAILHRPIPRLRTARADIPVELDAIVARALEKDPEARYPTADAMREALEGFVRGSGTVVRDADIGRAMSSMFKETREKVSKQVHEQMRLATPAASTSSIAALSLTDGMTPLEGGTPSRMKVRILVPDARESSATPPPLGADVPPPAPRKSARRRGAVVLALLAAATTFGLGLAVLAGRDGDGRAAATAKAPERPREEVPATPPVRDVPMPAARPVVSSTAVAPPAPFEPVAPSVVHHEATVRPAKNASARAVPARPTRDARPPAPPAPTAAETKAKEPPKIKVRILDDDDPKKAINIVSD